MTPPHQSAHQIVHFCEQIDFYLVTCGFCDSQTHLNKNVLHWSTSVFFLQKPATTCFLPHPIHKWLFMMNLPCINRKKQTSNIAEYKPRSIQILWFKLNHPL